jgi:cytochrome c oxidase assembly protein subunit 15
MRKVSSVATIALVFIFMVIIAGSVVRMTGSGMGCPDWPKCFGYIIPPTNADVLAWKSDHPFEKGQMIILDETLLVAQEAFISSSEFNAPHWEKYTKHDYATFNVAHTWTEYINRLLGALSGLPVLLLVFVCIKNRKKSNWLVILSLATLFMLGFEAWLGKIVVDGNLIPGQITIHMIGAVIIVILLLAIIAKSHSSKITIAQPLKTLLWFCVGLSLVQIILGSQVREQVDHLLEAGVTRNNIVANINSFFEWHRTIAILVIICNGLFIWKTNGLLKTNHTKWLIAFIALEVVVGISLSYFNLINWMQPLHLLFALLIFMVQVHLIFRSYFTSKQA